MVDHSPKHQSESILAYRWPTFFSELDQTFKGKPIMIERGGDLLLDDPFIPTGPLNNITFKSGRKNKFVLTTSGDQSQTITIKHLTLVWAVRNDEGGIVAVELISETDEKVVVRFFGSQG